MYKKLMVSTAFACLSLSACTNQISQGINSQGVAKTVIFPEPKKAWVKNGIFPNVENITKITPGVTKDDLYYLLGRPHFSESKGAREWDYIFKFKDQKTQSIFVCQYKVIFDKQMRGRSFYWLPKDCSSKISMPQNVIVKKVLTPKTIHSTREVMSLDADALFNFNKWRLRDVKPAGKKSLMRLLNKINRYQVKNKVVIQLVGHTDRLGSKEYNQKLSQRRANTVKRYLVQNGLNPRLISAYGVGETQPKITCEGVRNRNALIACLQPNRRVDVVVQTQ